MKKGGIHGFTTQHPRDAQIFFIEGLEERLLAMEQVPLKVHDFQEGSTKKETS